MAEERMIFRCEDSVDGIFTAIYKAWEYGTSRSSVELNICATMRLFVQYADVEADYGIALKVADTIRNRLSEEVYNIVWRASLSDGADKAEHIYRFLRKGFRMGASVIDYRQDEDVNAVCRMSEYAGREAHKYTGFVRFEENVNGVLVARIAPKNNIVPLIADHFADRLRQENWIIADVNRGCAAIHRAYMEPVIMMGISGDSIAALTTESADETEFKKLLHSFLNSVSIEERRNRRQQMTMMPLRYRTFMSAER